MRQMKDDVMKRFREYGAVIATFVLALTMVATKLSCRPTDTYPKNDNSLDAPYELEKDRSLQ